MRPAKPNIIERLAAKKLPQATLQAQDVAYVLVAARRSLGSFQGADLVTLAASINNIEAALAAMQPQPAPQPAAPPADKPAEKPKA